MFLAEETAKAFQFTPFDIFMILFTLLIAYGVYRLAKMPERTKFALGYAVLCLLVFLFIDFLMVLSWFGLLQGFQDQLFG